MAEIFKIQADAQNPFYKFTTTLEGSDYVLGFRWNDRGSTWYLDIFDENENPLALGIKMVINLDLTTRLKIQGLMPGQIILFDASGKNEECGYADLGDRCVLVYIPSE